MDKDRAVELVRLVRRECPRSGRFRIKEEYEVDNFVNGSTDSCSVLIEQLKNGPADWFCFTNWDVDSDREVENYILVLEIPSYFALELMRN